jgi:hypothetical protein
MVLIFRKNKFVAAISVTDGALLPEFNDIRRPIGRPPSQQLSREYAGVRSDCKSWHPERSFTTGETTYQKDAQRPPQIILIQG